LGLCCLPVRQQQGIIPMVESLYMSCFKKLEVVCR
jgi:hypothetical protein